MKHGLSNNVGTWELYGVDCYWALILLAEQLS